MKTLIFAATALAFVAAMHVPSPAYAGQGSCANCGYCPAKSCAKDGGQWAGNRKNCSPNYCKRSSTNGSGTTSK